MKKQIRFNAVSKNWENRNIAIKDLFLWDENSRLPDYLFNADQEKLIETFLSNEKKFKIKKLALEVIKDFDLPQVEKIIVLRSGKRYIALEGNRRLIVYKCLVKPKLAGKAESFFAEQASLIKIAAAYKLEALVTYDKVEANRFITRKHDRGNNEVGWGEFERHNHKIRTNKAAPKEILRWNLGKIVKEVGLPEELQNTILGKGYVSNFYRLLDSTPAYEILHFKQTPEGALEFKSKKDFLKKLKIIIFDLLSKREFNGKKLDSRSLNTNDQKRDYFNSLSRKDLDRVDKAIKRNTKKNLFGDKTIDIPKIYGTKKKKFTSLIDPSLKLPNISSEKIHEVFRELQIIVLADGPTASALLLRTLMELSVKEYARLNEKINIDNSGYFRTASGKTKESLKEKIDYISDKFAPNQVKETVRIFNAKSIFTDNLNKIAHSQYIFAEPGAIQGLYRNSKAFWEFLIEGIIKFESKKNRK